MKRLTRAARVTLQIAVDLGGSIHVYPDQRAIVTALEAQGLMIGNGQLVINRRSTITDAGRYALIASAADKF